MENKRIDLTIVKYLTPLRGEFVINGRRCVGKTDVSELVGTHYVTGKVVIINMRPEDMKTMSLKVSKAQDSSKKTGEENSQYASVNSALIDDNMKLMSENEKLNAQVLELDFQINVGGDSE